MFDGDVRVIAADATDRRRPVQTPRSRAKLVRRAEQPPASATSPP
ncbi:hypothetical protein [Halosegnis longus]